ncbi:MAG: glucuronate isomerase [Pyrinomonadaceae bacterium]|nr:glucuronate isomerase [Pyrinomonadaceae bacterium]
MDLRRTVNEIVAATPVFDMHTHLFPPAFGALNLWGIDELLTYHYLIAELFRSSDIAPTKFWQLTKPSQADLIWETLFVRNTPLSEATRGVVTVLAALGLNTRAKDLHEAREFFRTQRAEAYLERVLEIACVNNIVMTNDPFDSVEMPTWMSGAKSDRRFHAALRLDPILNEWSKAADAMRQQRYKVEMDGSGDTVKETRRFLDERIKQMEPRYLAVSLPDDFQFPEDSMRHRLMCDVVLPVCREHRLSLAMMIGVRRRVNPALRLAGDGVGSADVHAVERLCEEHSENRFLVTMLSRENQHELCVAARKFSNLMVFGCWWFLNNPSIVSEITRERLEMLGTSFIPQHSDARVLDQLIYKWSHARHCVADVLYEAYNRLCDTGRGITRSEIERDVARLFSGNFRQWVNLDSSNTAEKAYVAVD